MCFKNALFLKCEKHVFKKCKNYVKNAFFKANLKLCSLFLLHLILCFCSWQSLLCYRYIKQICDLHSPLPIDLNCSSLIFNLQKLGRQQSNCSKTGPKKIRVPPSQLDFQMFFFHIFPSAFSKRICSHFCKCIFKTHLVRIVFTLF